METNKQLQTTPSATTNSLMRFTEVCRQSPLMGLIHSKCPNVLSEPMVHGMTIAGAQRGYQLSVLRANFGAEMIAMMITVMLREAVAHFNHSISPDDLIGYARRIMVDYYWWRMEDLALCLNRGVAGVYGHTMARWTYGDTFLTWAEGYEKERVQWCVDNNVNKKFSDTRDLEISPAIFSDELKKKFEKKTIPSQSAQTRERNKMDELIENFEAMNLQQNKKKSCTGYVEYMGRKVDFQEYVNIKMDETL